MVIFSNFYGLLRISKLYLLFCYFFKSHTCTTIMSSMAPVHIHKGQFRSLNFFSSIRQLFVLKLSKKGLVSLVLLFYAEYSNFYGIKKIISALIQLCFFLRRRMVFFSQKKTKIHFMGFFCEN